MGAIALAFDDRIPAGGALGGLPPTWEAYRLFDQGLIEYSAYRYREAITLMLQAHGRDSTFTTALIYAAMATVNTSDFARTDSILTIVRGRRSRLSAYNAALAEFIETYRAGDHGRALAPIMRAIALAPESRGAYNAAYILLPLNRPADAEAMLKQLDHGPMRDWPAYWSQRAFSAHLLGHHEDELSLAREMKRRFPNQRVAWVIEARALAAMGKQAALDSFYESAATLDPDVYWSQGAMREVAAEEFELHRTGDSTAAYAEAARWLEARLAEEPEQRDHRVWLAEALLGLGRTDRAEQIVSQLDREGPVRLRERGALATIAAQRGNAPLAMRGCVRRPRRRVGSTRSTRRASPHCSATRKRRSPS